ncbi:hypothetical protein LBMAG49_10830 [Planctomycetota bacterium]|nr:hypothetical protein LBMAG49_10830 [Planctomycetota bacterium]
MPQQRWSSFSRAYHHTNRMRVCPTIEGPSTPLILHKISTTDCLSRQSCNYHKCHRCVYQGKASTWESGGVAADTQTLLPAGARGVPSEQVAPFTLPAKQVELPAKPPVTRAPVKQPAKPIATGGELRRHGAQ